MFQDVCDACMKRCIVTLLVFVLAACVSPSAAQTSQASGLPAWWTAHVDFMSRDGGTWVAPNPANDSDPAQPDAFGMEWRAVNEGYGLIGRLYGIEAGVETTEFWTYREFWHPGERRAILQQWGGPGVYGVGATGGETRYDRLEQTFWLADGRSWRDGHRTAEEGDIYVTHQFNIDEQDNWTPNGSYTWRRQRRTKAGRRQ